MTPEIKRILVPVDFSVNSRRALDYAHRLALSMEATIHLVHVCEMPGMATGSIDVYAVAYFDWTRLLVTEAEQQLARDAAQLKDVGPVTTEVLVGNPALAIVDAATANRSDLIVMGTHGNGAMMHLMMGNVAERVVRMAPCPVLTVREPRQREIAEGRAAKLAAAGS